MRAHFHYFIIFLSIWGIAVSMLQTKSVAQDFNHTDFIDDLYAQSTLEGDILTGQKSLPIYKDGRIKFVLKDSGIAQYAVSFNYIIENEVVGTFDYDPWVQTIDLRSKTSLLARNISEITRRINRRILTGNNVKDPFLNELLKLRRKKRWSIKDRIHWEKNLSQIVSNEIDKVKTLNIYRTTPKGQSQRRAKHLNELDEDIKNGTTNIEFDCEQMSVIKGIIIQNVENKILPAYSRQTQLKSNLNYYYVTGEVSYGNDTSNGSGGHAFILTPTLNIIESTNRREQNYVNYNYRLNTHNNLSIASVLSGTPLVTVDSFTGDLDIYFTRSFIKTNMNATRSKAARNPSIVKIQNAVNDRTAYFNLLAEHTRTKNWPAGWVYTNPDNMINNFYNVYFVKISSKATAEKLTPVIQHAYMLTQGKIGNPFQGTQFEKIGTQAIKDIR